MHTPTRPRQQTVSLQITPELMERIRQTAIRRGWDLSYAITLLLSRGLAAEKRAACAAAAGPSERRMVF